MGSQRPRRWWLAFLLSLLCAGLGHLYAGRRRRACVAFALACFVLIPAAACVLLVGSWSRVTLIASASAAIALALIVHIDAALTVKRFPVGPNDPPIRWFYYVGFVILAGILLELLPLGLFPLLPSRVMKVPTGAMLPTILVGDHVVVDWYARWGIPVHPGDIVVFASPDDADTKWVKRLVGVPGSVIEVRGGVLYVDGVARSSSAGLSGQDRLAREKLGDHEYEVAITPHPGFGCLDWGPEQIPEGSFFMLGDNRCNSRDSRSFGAVRRETLLGRVRLVHWSTDSETGAVRWERLGMNLVRR